MTIMTRQNLHKDSYEKEKPEDDNYDKEIPKIQIVKKYIWKLTNLIKHKCEKRTLPTRETERWQF